MNGVDPRGLDYPFRQRCLEMLKAKINEFAKKTNNPIIYDTINSMASKLEVMVFEKATSKQDYVYRLDQKVRNGLAKSVAGNQLGSSAAGQSPDVLSAKYQASQAHHVPTTLSAMQPANLAVHNRQFVQQNSQFVQQNHQFGQRNQQFGQQTVVQNPPPVQPNSVMNVNGSFNQVGNGHTQYATAYQASQQQYSSPMVSTHAQRNLFPVTQMPSTTSAPAVTPISAPRHTNAEEFKLLRTQFHRVRSSYLPELYKWLKYFQARYNQAQTVAQREPLRAPISFTNEMIQFLNYSENQLMQYDNQRLRSKLNSVIQYYNHTRKKMNTSAVSQAHQYSSLQRSACSNVTQNTQTAQVLMSRPLVSLSTINPGFTDLNSSARNSIVHDSVSTAEQMDTKNGILHFGIQGSADFNAHESDSPTTQASQTAQPTEMPQSVNLPEKRKYPMDSTTNPATNNASCKLPETRKDVTDSTSKPSTNATCRVLKKPKTQSSESSLKSWLDLASVRSNKRSIPTRFGLSSPANSEQKRDNTQPSTPMTPSSVSSGVLDSPTANIAQIETVSEERNPSLERPPMLDGLGALLRTPETLTVSPVVSDCTDPESPPQQPPEKQPIDRLLDAVKSASMETLLSAAGEMRSALIDMDELPDYAYVDDFDVPTLDDDMTDFLETLNYDCVDDEHQQQLQPNTRLKRDIESVSRDASCPPSTPDCTTSNKQSSKSESNRKLLDEINDTNQKLFRTVVKVVSDSSDQRNGSVVRVTYIPIDLRADILRSMFACESINLSIEFLVPSDYPSSPPKILGCKLPDFGVAREMTELSKSLFDTQVRSVDPLRVGEMAQAWDHCARSVFVSYAKRYGRDVLISEYGDWESA